MPGVIKAVIWDMGGVLLRSIDDRSRRELAVRYVIALRELYEVVFESETARLANVGAISEEEHWQQVGKIIGVAPADLHHFQLQFWAGNEVDTRLIEYIQKLRGAYQTALLSNAWSGARKAVTEHYDCLRVFDQIIISAEVKLAKPDPAIYVEMLKRLAVEPYQAIFVDDLRENIETAISLGIQGILFQNTEQAIADVESKLA